MKHFNYPTPFQSELKELYQTPYRFSPELREYVHLMFAHPTCNRHHGIYFKLHQEWDTNDMIKPAYRIAKYYLDHPNQFGGAIENCHDAMISDMWRVFMSLHRIAREAKFPKYLPADMRIMGIGKGRFLDLLLEEIGQGKMIMSQTEMRKAPRPKRKKNTNFEYLCSLD